VLGTVGGPGSYYEPDLSSDGHQLALAVGADSADIWIFDLERESRRRLTFDPADDRQPQWSPDGDRLAYVSAQKAEGEIWVQPTSGQGDAQLVYTAGTSIVLTDWSSDGRQVFFSYQELVGDNDLDIWVLDMQTLEAKPLVAGKFTQDGARLSPDRKWLAFRSNESGKTEIYVQRFPVPDGRWMVSNDDGASEADQPVWSDDGRELFYQRGNSVFAIPATQTAGFAFGTPRALFRVNVKSGVGATLLVADHGRRILCNELPPADPSMAGARLIQNWSTMLAAR